MKIYPDSEECGSYDPGLSPRSIRGIVSNDNTLNELDSKKRPIEFSRSLKITAYKKSSI